MADRMITVASYHVSYEAELARGLLEAEGVRAFLAGEMAGNTMPGLGRESEVRVQVHEEDAPRATAILASQEAALDDDWESEAERGVWVCSLCDSPIPHGKDACPVCASARVPTAHPEGIQTRDQIAREPRPVSPPSPITSEPAVPEVSLPAAAPAADDEAEVEEEISPGDELVQRAFLGALLSIVTCTFLIPLSWYYLIRLLLYSGDLSASGRRYLRAAFAINVLVLGFWGFLWVITH